MSQFVVEALRSGTQYKYYASVAADVNLLTVGGNYPGRACRGIYVGATGDIVVTDVTGNSVTFASVPAGVVLPIQANSIVSSGTTASKLTVIW